MATPWHRRVIIGFGSVAFVLAVVLYGYDWYISASEEARQSSLEIMGVEQLVERELHFSKSPEISDCMWLVDKVGFVKKDLLKAISYGKKCLELPGSEDNRWLINFWLASLHNSMNDRAHAKEYLSRAIEMDKRNVITGNGWIESEGLRSIYAEIKP